jgi:hypothetical protein
MATTEPARRLMTRPTAPILATLAILLAACNEVGSASLTFWDVIFATIALFFWFMFIWIFIALFGDIFRRDDLSGGAKAGWIFLLVILPFLGSLIYMIARPKVTAQDVRQMAQADAAIQAAAAVSPADEIAKLTQLRSAGAITDEEFATLKQKALS